METVAITRDMIANAPSKPKVSGRGRKPNPLIAEVAAFCASDEYGLARKLKDSEMASPWRAAFIRANGGEGTKTADYDSALAAFGLREVFLGSEGSGDTKRTTLSVVRHDGSDEGSDSDES